MPFDFAAVPDRLEALDALASGRPRGLALERLVGEMFASLPGVRVAETNVVSGSGEAEFDIVLTNEQLETGLPGFGRDVIVECKSSAERLGARHVAHFLHQAHMRNNHWSVLVALAGITGDQDDWRAAHQVVAQFAAMDIRLIVLEKEELGAIRSVEHFGAVIEAKRSRGRARQTTVRLAPKDIRELDPRFGKVKVQTGMEAFQRAMNRMHDDALYLVLDRALGLARPETDTALVDTAREAVGALDQEMEKREAESEPDPFMRDVRDRVVDVGASFANILDEDLTDEARRKNLAFDVRVSAPQNLRAHASRELWDLLTKYRLEQIAEHDGYTRRDNALAMLAMVVEEIIAIDNIDPADVYGHDPNGHIES